MFEHEIVLPAELKDLLTSCEANCVIACCGEDACDFSEARFALWLTAQGGPRERAAVLPQVDAVLASLRASSADGATSADLNQTWPLKEAVGFFLEVRATLEGAIKATFPEEA